MGLCEARVDHIVDRERRHTDLSTTVLHMSQLLLTGTDLKEGATYT